MEKRLFGYISLVEFFSVVFAFKYFFPFFKGFTIWRFSGPDNFRVAREHSEKKKFERFLMIRNTKIKPSVCEESKQRRI
jgi:hypothetical protein